ncbi:uncharacterized protein PY17X_0317800 [Plasmodium yoelii]|uniref:PIR protein n=3 Tax=Plasmodium yoelii TaxID=5861 RepID=A0AAE9WKA1_PLAYO|nr:uncharacterized protein PY17X_0317800 [Plasmodium yoelii]EAA18707.1 putative yir1 protein [Plasmodium yoelii yoelii]WBY55106.1 PIR protein [Plasmodium yoelii yoelii]CDU16362.1 YIR protein [Plasmodium yoelii]VTZ72681.1 PIR protein [Plasmodium yoelii]|eukprot:XP_727142.1 uncharacterized protein PY17X_0317800 [Plasmodium yoelii]
MDPDLCENFDIVIQNYTDKIKNSEEYDIQNIPGIEEYCHDGESEEKKCKTEVDKINAACLWLLEQNVAHRIDDLSKEKINMFIIYIMIWLSYMLNLKNVNNINNLKDFYEAHIKNNSHYTNCNNDDQDCSNTLKKKTGYSNFNEIIATNMDFEYIFKFYDAFKLLCKMHTESNENTLECTEYLEYANDIVDKFKELNESSSVTGNTSYSQIWSTLSTDYDSFKKKCNSFPSLPSIKTTQHVQSYEDHSEDSSLQNYGVTSSSLSIVNRIIIALSIFSAITIFLGIFYKCSLFVLRKRAQKQHLKEKLKT